MRCAGRYFIAALLLPAASAAHHSVTAVFDQSKKIELEGELTALRWQNPHVLLTIKVVAADGKEVVWDLESLSANGISRSGVTASLFVVGNRLKVAGSPSRHGLNRLFLNNVLLPNGREIVLGGEQRQPRWSQQVLRASETAQQRVGVAAVAERGIFRVWSSGPDFRSRYPNIADASDPLRFPLTAAGRAAVAAPQSEDPTVRCVPKPMPRIMTQPYPIEFVRQGDTILIKIEEYDVVRTIHVGVAAEAGRVKAASSPLGYSVGRFDGRTLVVTTTKLASGRFDGGGGGRIALSADATLVERISPSDDGSRLDYRMTITDPTTFTASVALEKTWIYVPGTQVMPYRCQQ
jgi:Family of unknown function (DUF6152)